LQERGVFVIEKHVLINEIAVSPVARILFSDVLTESRMTELASLTVYNTITPQCHPILWLSVPVPCPDN